MEMQLAGLRFVVGRQLQIHILPGVGSRCHSFFLLFCWPRLKRCKSLYETKQEPRAVLAARSWGQILVQF
jgi:hypothetical protein